MATYVQADKATLKLLEDTKKKYHGELVEAGVTVGCLLAHAPVNEATGEPKGPALKFANWPAAAIIKLNSLKDRVEGKPDATIVIDGDTWKDRAEEEQAALIDHELQHLEIRKDEEGGIMLDDANRPKLKLRPHDFQLGGFDVIAGRHKTSALEVQSYIDLNRRFHQASFNFG